MPSRIGGRRSSTGCVQCRQRHVKCDETLPVCQRCQRAERSCSLSSLALVGAQPDATSSATHVVPPGKYHRWRLVDPSSRKPRAANRRAQDSESSRSPTHTNDSAPLSLDKDDDSIVVADRYPAMGLSCIITAMPEHSPIPNEPASTIDLSKFDQALVEQFIEYTSPTLVDSDVVLELFQTTAPALASTRSYLMFSILAIAATHRLATGTPYNTGARIPGTKEQALLRGHILEYHNRSLELYSSQIASTATREDCVATCITSLFIMLFTLATSHFERSRSIDAHDCRVLEKAYDLLKMQAGIKAVFWSRRAQTEHSELEGILHGYPPPIDSAQTLDRAIVQSLTALDRTCSSPALSEVELETYAIAIQGLWRVFRAVDKNSRDLGNRLGWVEGETASYLADLVNTRSPEALLVLAHWAATLHQEPETWWEMGFGQSLIDSIHTLLPLDQKMHFGWLFRHVR